jgi:hypothetical protein
MANSTDTAEQIHSFADFADARPPLKGDKKRMEEVLNKPIIIKGYKSIPSKKNAGQMCLHLQFEMDGELCILFSGSVVLIDLCDKYADKIPFRATIIRVDKFFTFS